MSKAILVWDGSQFVPANVPVGAVPNAVVSYNSSEPANPRTGQAWFDTNTNKLKVYSGSAWIEVSADVDLSAIQTELSEKSPLLFVENIQTANYTLAMSDIAKIIAFNSASNLTLTVPTNASVAFPIGTVINVYRANTGTVTIAGASGVTVRNAGTIPAQFGERSLRKRGTDEWVLM